MTANQPNKLPALETIDWRAHVVIDPGVLGGKPTIKGTRLAIEFVLELMAGGWSHEKILTSYPKLTTASLRAALAYAAQTLRDDRSHLLPHGETVMRFRVAEGSRIEDVPDFPYFLSLMAGLESLRASLRWFSRIESDESTVWASDIWHATIAGAGWCAELIRLLKNGIRNGVIQVEMIEDAPDLKTIWDRVTSEPSEELVGKIHRIRDKCFGHWDEQVMKAFLDQQQQATETEPFIESDADGQFLHTRYLWPGAAFAFDFAGQPKKDGYGEETRELVAGLGELWTHTAKLVAHILKVWFEAVVASGHLKFLPVENEEGQA